ncbi:MAG: hypothetical protein ITD28_05950, partial [Nitrospira sp.]|nr:hypothetical protein [Nitrospira sp.]
CLRISCNSFLSSSIPVFFPASAPAVIVIEHDMEFVRQIARTVTVLHEGAVICEGPVEKVQADDRVREIYLGRQKVAYT